MVESLSIVRVLCALSYIMGMASRNQHNVVIDKMVFCGKQWLSLCLFREFLSEARPARQFWSELCVWRAPETDLFVAVVSSSPWF